MFYIFHGGDQPKKRETLDRLLERLGDPPMLDLNTTRFSGIPPLNQLKQAAETMPFLAPARVVLVEDLFLAKPSKEYLEELLSFLPHVPETTRLVFLESQALRKNHPALKLAAELEQGVVRAFPLPEGSQVDRWIQQQAKNKGGDIAPRAANLLASLAGNDLALLDNELEKLVAYKSSVPDTRIEVEDVSILSPYVAESSIFDLVDALGNRNGARASALYQRKLNEGADPFYLFSMFVRQFRLLIQIKELVEEGYNAPAMARELHLHEFVVSKLNQQARGFAMEDLETIYRHLLSIDVSVKSGKADMRTELDLLLASLTYTV
ncbi:MAG: DNA polymerase III subunit delta [Candidatus Promineifilaceae bacterium]